MKKKSKNQPSAQMIANIAGVSLTPDMLVSRDAIADSALYKLELGKCIRLSDTGAVEAA
jgi:hypothetical protein